MGFFMLVDSSFSFATIGVKTSFPAKKAHSGTDDLKRCLNFAAPGVSPGASATSALRHHKTRANWGGNTSGRGFLSKFGQKPASIEVFRF
jgi:hypothetical protein